MISVLFMEGQPLNLWIPRAMFSPGISGQQPL